jgi:hypothetical protein
MMTCPGMNPIELQKLTDRRIRNRGHSAGAGATLQVLAPLLFLTLEALWEFSWVLLFDQEVTEQSLGCNRT